jgi:hypothetical protein
MNYANILTDEQKEAFRKGDAYYKSPFKKTAVKMALCNMSVKDTGSIYNTTSSTRIHEALIDSWKSKSWN